MTRGQAVVALRASLQAQGLYRGEVEQEGEILRSKFGDLVCLRDVRDVREVKEQEDINLRKPILVVSTGKDQPNVSFSSNCNCKACDNKVISEVGGRTGGFCTGCDCNEQDMHLPRASLVYTMNMGIDKAWKHFGEMREMLVVEELQRTNEIEIPSTRDDFRFRLGTKRAPLTTQVDVNQVALLSSNS